MGFEVHPAAAHKIRALSAKATGVYLEIAAKLKQLQEMEAGIRYRKEKWLGSFDDGSIVYLLFPEPPGWLVLLVWKPGPDGFEMIVDLLPRRDARSSVPPLVHRAGMLAGLEATLKSLRPSGDDDE